MARSVLVIAHAVAKIGSVRGDGEYRCGVRAQVLGADVLTPLRHAAGLD